MSSVLTYLLSACCQLLRLPHIKVSQRFSVTSTLVLASLFVSLSGCVVRDRDYHGYSQGYKERYYDREHHRWWHDEAWHACTEEDVHCH